MQVASSPKKEGMMQGKEGTDTRKNRKKNPTANKQKIPTTLRRKTKQNTALLCCKFWREFISLTRINTNTQ